MSSDVSDSGEDEQPEKHLRFADVMSEVPDGNVAAAKELVLGGRGLSSCDTLESAKSLVKLELQGNRLRSLDFVEMNHSLCWLGLKGNRLRGLSHLGNLTALAVLDVSDNKISRLSGLQGLSCLKALIAARNQIRVLDGLSPKENPILETLVLSHNLVEDCSLSGFKGLRKLSLGHNKLHAFPQLANLPALSELRLNGNKISAVSAVVCELPKLSILDVGNNLVTEAGGLAPLTGLWLKSLSVKGNPVAEKADGEALAPLLASLVKLDVLNDRRHGDSGKKKKMRQGVDFDVWMSEGGKGEKGKGKGEKGWGKGEKGGKGKDGKGWASADGGSWGSSWTASTDGGRGWGRGRGMSADGGRGRGGRGRGARDESAAEPAKKVLEVHGRTFQGAKKVFQDSDDEAEQAPKKRKKTAGDKGEGEAGEAPKKKLKKKKAKGSAPAAEAAPEKAAAEPGKKKLLKKKAKKPKAA